MKYNEHICWIVSFVFCFLIKSTPAASGTKKERQLKWQTERARKVLSEVISDTKTFEDELAPFLKVRVSGTPANKKVQEHIKNHMLRLNWKVEEDRFIDDTPYGPVEFNNIIATYNPHAAERLVLACHFDSKYFEKKKFIGATDSAVPCAILLDLARQFQCLLLKEPSKASAKNLTVQLLFLDGEEAFVHWSDKDSIYGARHLAEKWANIPDPVNPSRRYIDTISDFVLLDLIGAEDTKFYNLMPETAGLYTQLNKIEKALAKQKLLKRQDPNRRKGYNHDLFPTMAAFRAGIQDDHVPFQSHGVKILHLISYPFPKVWHKETDNISSMDMSLIEDFNRIFRVFVASYLQYNGLQSTGCRKFPDYFDNAWINNDDYEPEPSETSSNSWTSNSGGVATVSARREVWVFLPFIGLEVWFCSTKSLQCLRKNLYLKFLCMSVITVCGQILNAWGLFC